MSNASIVMSAGIINTTPNTSALAVSLQNTSGGRPYPKLRRSATLRRRARTMNPTTSSSMPMRLEIRWNFGLSSNGETRSHAG
jgi:hypothetical protein